MDIHDFKSGFFHIVSYLLHREGLITPPSGSYHDPFYDEHGLLTEIHHLFLACIAIHFQGNRARLTGLEWYRPDLELEAEVDRRASPFRPLLERLKRRMDDRIAETAERDMWAAGRMWEARRFLPEL